MVLADFARAAALAIVVVDLELQGFQLLPILVANFVVGAFTTLFNPVEQALVPSLVAAPLVADANGLVRSSRSSLQFVGAAIGGALIVTVGSVAGVAANSITFLVSGLLLLGMVLPGRSPARRPRAPDTSPTSRPGCVGSGGRRGSSS